MATLSKCGVLLLLLLLASCKDSDGDEFEWFECADDVMGEVASPGNLLKVVSATRDCGATTAISTSVFLGNISERTEVLVRQKPIVSVRGKHVIRSIWKDERHVTIAVPTFPLYSQKFSWKDVTISYELPPAETKGR